MTREPKNGRNDKPYDHCPDRKSIRQIVQGVATEFDLDAFAEHLVHCHACSEIFERMLRADSPFGGKIWLSERRRSDSRSRPQFDGTRFGDYPFDGRFRFLSKIGRGTMGEVYEAFDTKLSRRVAVKSIPADRFDHGELERLTNEVCFQACLNHPNILTIHDIVLLNGNLAIVMESIAGGSLKKAIEQGPLFSSFTAQLIGQVTRALQFAHSNGVVHSAVKPSNILLTTHAVDNVSPHANLVVAKLSDFGMARDHGEWFNGNGKHNERLAYRAPELFALMRSRSTTASDIYAVGVILYEVLTGRRPFQGDSASDLIDTIRTVDPIPPRMIDPVIDPRLEAICLRCLEKDPAHRYPDARELAIDLESCVAARPKPPSSFWERLKSYWQGGGPGGR